MHFKGAPRDGDGTQAIGSRLLRAGGSERRPSIFGTMPRLLAGVAAALCLSAVAAQAQDATWSTAPTTSDWNTGTNWVGGSVPTGTATFGASNATTVTFSQNVTNIGGLTFDLAAPAYTFASDKDLIVNGAGIINNSSNAPTFAFNNGALFFGNSSTAGNAVINVAGTNAGFRNTATAGNATINATANSHIGFDNSASAGDATISVDGTSRLFFSGSGSGGNARIVNAGTVDLSELDSAGTTFGSIEGGGVFYLGSKKLSVGSNGIDTLVSGVISDCGSGDDDCARVLTTGGSLVKVGTGTLTLSGANTYTGGTTLSAGGITLGNAGALGSGSLTVAGDGSLETTGNFTIGNTISLNSGTRLTLAGTNAFGLSGTITGAGGLTISDTGVVTLSGANLFAGGVNLNAGGIKLGNAGALGSGTLTVGGNASLDSTGAFIVANNVVLNAGTLNLVGSNALALNGTISGPGTLTKSGAGTLTLGGASSFSGSFNIAAGSVAVSASGSLSSTSAVSLSGAGAVLDISGASANQTVGSLAGVAGTTLALGSRTLTAGGLGGNTNFGGTISGASGRLVKTGTGSLTLSGFNTYGGGTTLSAGGIRLGNGGALGSGALTVAGDGSLETTGNFTVGNNIQLNGGSTLSLVGGNGLALNGAISGTGNLTKSNLSTLTLGGASSFTGSFNIAVGTVIVGVNGSLSSTSAVDLSGVGATLNISGASASQTIGSLAGGAGANISLGANTLTVGGLGGNTLYAGSIDGMGGLVKTGTGALTLSGSSTYSGGTTISAGKIIVGKADALGTGTVTMADGSSLGFLANYTIGNSFTLAGNATFDVGAANTDTLSGIIGDGAPAGALIKTGAGTLILSGQNTYSGGTTIEAGTLKLGAIGALGTGGLDTTNAGTFDLAGFSQTVTTLNGQAGSFITNSLAADTLTVTGSGEFDGVISGSHAMSLAKTGSGTLTLNGINTYTGVTAISGGTLIVGDDGHSSAAIAGNVVVQNGGTLGGHGSVGSTVVNSGGTLAPGASIGTLTVNGDLTLNQGSILTYEFGAPGSNFTTPGVSDSQHVTGDLSVNGVTLSINDAGGFGPGLYRLADYGGSLSLSNGGIIPPPGAGYTIQNLTAAKQINLINTAGLTLNFWNANGLASGTQLGGGDGTWSRHSQNWTNADGSVTAEMSPQPGFAIFGGAAGLVTVDNSGGAIAVTGMQFASDGYTLNGNPLSLVTDADHPAPIEIRVGDGSAGSAAWTATIDNVVANNNGLRKTGAGTLVLNGANIYAGGTTLEAGTLSVSSDGNLGNASSGLTFNGGTLRVTGTAYTSTARAVTLTGAGTIDIADAANRFMLNAVVSGDGSLTKQGAGTLRLGEANTYTGATIINAGTLSLKGPGSIATSSSLTINGGAFDLTGFGNDTSVNNLSGTGGAVILASSTLTVNQSVDGLFAGTISGAGGWIKTGTAKLILDGDSSASSGLTAVDAGTLVVGSAAGSTAKLGGSLTVGDTATLMGYGRIGSGAGSSVTVASGGTVSPGGSIGTLTIDGDYVQQAGSTYFAEIAPDGTSDLISVTGAATIEGGTVYASKETGSYTPGTNYKILTAVDGVSGTYDTLDQNTPFVDLKLTYDPNAVYIRAVRNNVDFCAVAASANQCAVANAVQGLADGNTLFDAVAGVPSADVARSAFEQLSGNIHVAGKSVLIETSELIGDLIDARLRSAFGAVAADSAPVLAYGEQGTDNRATAAIDGQLAPADTLAPAAWGTAFGDWGHVGGDTRTSSSTGGFLTGIDAALGGGWRGGVVAGYSHTSFDSDKESGDSQNWHLGLYGGNQWGALGFRAGAAYTWHDLSTARSVDFPGFSDRLSADYDAATAQVFGELAYDVKAGTVGLEPFANLSYINLHTDGFVEKGGAAALTSPSATTDATFTTLGLRASTDISFGSVTATARGTLGWRHAFDDAAQSVFTIDGSDPFTITAPIARDAALIEAGLDFALSPNVKLGLDYRGQLASDASQNGFNARLDVRF